MHEFKQDIMSLNPNTSFTGITLSYFTVQNYNKINN